MSMLGATLDLSIGTMLIRDYGAGDQGLQVVLAFGMLGMHSAWNFC